MKYLYAVLILAFILRIVMLDVLPNGLTNDELTGVMNAYSLVRTGENLDGWPWWKALFLTSPGVAVAEFHSFILAPIVGLFGLSLWSARLTNVIAGTLTIFLLYNFVFVLMKRRDVALASAAILAISPWHTFLSRSAYEAPVALMWITLALYAFFATFRGASIIVALSLICAFHSYHAMKVAVPLLAMGLLVWGIVTKYELRKTRERALIVVLGWILVFTPIFFAYSSQSSRVSELETKGERSIEKQVAEFAQRSSFPLWMSRMVMNKVTIQGYEYLVRAYGYFDVERLFLGEQRDVGYPIYRHGVLHPLDWVLLLIGLYGLWKWDCSKSVLLLIVFGATIAPSVVSQSGVSYLYRSHASLVVLYTVMGIELVELWMLRGYALIIRGATIVVLFGSLVHFMVQYVGYMPAWGATWFNMHYKLMATYSESLDPGTPFTSVSNDPQRAFLQYAFYYPERISIDELKQQYRQKDIRIDQVRFTDNCPEVMEGVVMIDYPRLSCEESKNPKGALTDAERNWIVYGDVLCGDEVAVFETFVPQWSYEAMSAIRLNNAKDMCRTWFYRL